MKDTHRPQLRDVRLTMSRAQQTALRSTVIIAERFLVGDRLRLREFRESCAQTLMEPSEHYRHVNALNESREWNCVAIDGVAT
jgi:hypothetical protein